MNAETTSSSQSAPIVGGTVTFVFSDVEGSTRLLNTLREEYGQLLDDYYAIVGAAFEQNGGVELDRAGDGLFHSFPSARRAAAAAAEAQRGMAEHEWPANAVVRARMGLHTGEPIGTRTRYFGMDVHRAARIAAAGHGGQILLSQTTRDLVSSDLPADATLVDLGQHWLKDLAEPEHLYQLSVEGLPHGFPPLRSLTTLPNNLPRHLSTFVGRQSDLTEVRQLVSQAPLVTLTGPGGVGKTRLALQLAAEMLDTFVDGAWLVELEALTDGSLVPQEVAIALGVARDSDADTSAALHAHIRGRQMLIILDTCEHLIDACAKLANNLLRSCPGLRILATSREALGVAGERLYPVRSLTLPTELRGKPDQLAGEYEAIGLFDERARAADPTFEITADNASAVIEICHRLDGIPLAIELAAARVRALTVQQIAERLDDRFRLLTGGSRTVMPRHQTLRAAIDWSFDLLPGEERAVLWRLSVFAGAFTLEAAEAVCAAGEVERFEVLDDVTRLVEKSLVFRQNEMFRILETVRGYAREHSLEAGESEGAYARHRDWYLELVRQAGPQFFRGPESAPWLDRLDAEHDNLRAALAWSINEPGGAHSALELVAGLWRFWEIRGYLVEGRSWLDRVLAMSDEVSPLRADALTGAGILAGAQGDHAAAVRYHEQSLSIHEELGNALSVQYALNNLANAALHHGDHDRARRLYEKVVERASASDPQGLPFSLVNLADVADRQGDYEAAKGYYEQALGAIGAQGNVWAAAYALASYGQSAARHGDGDLAHERYEEALSIYRQTGDERGEARVMTSLAELAASQNDDAVARELLYEALRIRCRLGDSQGICTSLERISASATPDDADRAARILAAAAALRERTGARLSLKDQAQIDQQLASLQTSLGGDRFQRAWRDGTSASLDDAVMDAAALAGH